VIKSLVIGMRDDKELEAMLNELSPFVDAFITDTFDPKTGASGATGKTHDWRVSRRLVELADRPVMLAGGTNAGERQESDSRSMAGGSRFSHRRRRLQWPQEP
jgi:phosphoribosylanthranilate isomerase